MNDETSIHNHFIYYLNSSLDADVGFVYIIG